VIGLVLQTDVDGDPAVRAAAGDSPGIEVAGAGGPSIFERADLDALLLNEWMASEYFASPVPTVPAQVVVDEASGASVRLLQAVVSRNRDPRRQMDVPAPWIVTLASLPAALSEEAKQGAGEADAAPRHTHPTDEDKQYAIVLNALEVMERHNAASAEPKIRRAGLLVGPSWMPALLRAYDTYRERAEAGRYGPAGRGQSES